MFMVETPVRLDIPWEALEGIVKGISSIDMGQMTIRNLEEAERFIFNYGYDINNPNDREELIEIQKEAVSFIERRFLYPEAAWREQGIEALDLQIPPSLYEDADTRKLLMMASTPDTEEQPWACAILKVMHTICHINNAVLYRHFEEAKRQILARYYKALSHTESGELLFGDPNDLRLAIAGFEIKDEKSRDSMITKLLCKRENVAEEVFDMIGVRIITHTPVEAVLALEILRRNKVIIFPNIIPSRSRNSLIEFDAFKAQYQEALETYQLGKANLNETLQLIEHISAEKAGDVFNPDNASTLASYRGLHITERQLIRFKMPGSQEETRFFFPYEIQLVDEAGYVQNHSGSSAHMLYKQNQLLQARRRVLGPLLLAERKQKRHAAQNLAPKPLS